jgi:uncharacterized protein
MNAMAETSFSQKTYPKRPTESRLYDDNHLLDASETKLFDNLAEEFFQKTGIELTCVLTDNIPYSSERIEDYARETASTWNLGKESGEGIMIFVIQKRHAKNIFVTSAAQKIFKERDLERIMQKTLLPAFREYNYNEGILSLSYALAKKGADAKKVSLNIDESLYKLSQNKTSSLMILFILFIFFLTLMAKFSGGRGNGILWFLFGGAIKNKKKDETEKTGFGGGFGSSPSGFGGGFGGGLGGGFGSAMSRYGKRDSW